MRTKRIVRLWERMQAMYGSRWLLEYGPALAASGELASIAAIWADALDDARNSAIATGLRKCLERDRETPPGLPEFLRLCGAKLGQQPRDTRPALPQLPPYSDNPRARMETLAKELAAQAEIDLVGRFSGTDDKQRAEIIRAYWMAKIGATLIGKTLVQEWKEAA